MVVVSSMRQGKALNRAHGVKTASLEQGTNGFFQGRLAPVVFDLDAVQNIVRQYEDKIDRLSARIERHEAAVSIVKEALDS